MAFWALEVIPGKEFTAVPPFDLHLTQVVLPANAHDNGRSVLQAKIDDKQFAVASLKLDRQENISLDLIFEAGKQILFTVSGKNPVQLLGYYIDNQGGLSDDEDGLGGEGFDFDDEDEEIDSDEGDDDLDEDDEDEDDELDEEEITQATLKELQAKRKIELAQQNNGAKKAKIEQPQQQKGQQQKGQPQQKQTPPQQQKGQQNQQQKGQQNQQQAKPQTPQNQQQRPQTPKQDQKGTPQQKEQREGNSRNVSGVKIDTMTIGTGAQAQVGKKVHVMYTGRLENGKVFDKSRSPFGFRLGGGEVIKGWDIGVNGMRVGEKRRLTIPAPLGYGRSGAPPDIPGNATLIFDVELIRV